MEKLGQIIKARQSAESGALALPGMQRLTRDSMVQLGTMLRQMSAAFPHQEYDGETTKVFLMTFEDLALEFGVPNLEQALRRFLSRQKFFPHPAEVREVLEEMKQKAQSELNRALPKIGCDKCMQTGEDGLPHGLEGFIYVQRPGQPQFVKPCECRLARERAKKALEGVKS